jgi:hypothetical protein
MQPLGAADTPTYLFAAPSAPSFTGRFLPGPAATGPRMLPRHARMASKGFRPWTHWSSILLVGADRPADGAMTGRPVSEEKAWRRSNTTRSA